MGIAIMQGHLQEILAIGGAIVTFVVWLVRLEGRINLSDARYQDIKDDLGEMHRDTRDSLNELHRKIDKVRSFIGRYDGERS